MASAEKNDTGDHDNERRRLSWMAGGTILWLILFGAASLTTAILLLGGLVCIDDKVGGAVLGVLGGTLGSSISALVSCAERVSHGWEFSRGGTYPAKEPAGKFVARMVPFFIIRPLLGAAVGFLTYVGIVGGFLIVLQNAEDVTFSDEGLLFITILTGLFAKTFLEKMRDAFDTLFGKQKAPDAKTKDEAEKEEAKKDEKKEDEKQDEMESDETGSDGEKGNEEKK